jgi:hypothetical protein
VINHLFSRIFRPSAEIRQQATDLATFHGPRSAWLAARDGLRDALENRHWLDDDELRRRSRYWNSIMREIERQSGYRHQPDAETPYME